MLCQIQNGLKLKLNGRSPLGAKVFCLRKQQTKRTRRGSAISSWTENQYAVRRGRGGGRRGNPDASPGISKRGAKVPLLDFSTERLLPPPDFPTNSAIEPEVYAHGKMPDVVLHYTDKNWLLLVESVTSHGPVDGKRHAELSELFAGSKSGLVYVTAFPNRAIMGRYLGEIAWETEVWVADAPSHLIHFNGERFLGPYSAE